MVTSAGDGWRQSSRSELWACARVQAPPTPPAASRATVAVRYLQINREFPRQFRGSTVLPFRWLPTLIAVMADLLFIVSPMEPGRYVYLKYGVARRNGD